MFRTIGLAAGLVALSVIGCGRLRFDSPSGEDAGPNDAPPVPVSICQVDRVPIASMPTAADLAITGTADGYAAVWIDPSGTAPAQGLLLEMNLQPRAKLALPAIKDTRLGGLTDVGQKLVLSTGEGMFQTTWILSHDLTTVSRGTPVSDYVVAHGQYPSDSGRLQRVFVTAIGTTLTAAYIGDDGLINMASTVSHDATSRVTDLACTDGPDHAHCVWAEALSTVNGASQCTASDVKLRPVPSIPGGPILSGDCYNVRTSSGPDAADSMIVVWTTANRRVEARYVGGGGLDMAHSIAPTGSAPKVQFDGDQFWISWIDGQGVLQLASFDISGKIDTYALPGWVPIGPGAFELVRRRNQTALVLLSRDGLELLTICT